MPAMTQKKMLPTAMAILQTLSKWYDIKRKECPYLKPDGKAQITGYYSDEMKLQKNKIFYNLIPKMMKSTEITLII